MKAMKEEAKKSFLPEGRITEEATKPAPLIGEHNKQICLRGIIRFK